MSLEIQLVSSLEKVFSDEGLHAPAYTHMTALRGERVNFQVACRTMDEERVYVAAVVGLSWETTAELYEVGQAAVTFPCYKQTDEHYLRTTPGLYPDPLFSHKGEMRVVHDQWRCLWVSFEVPEDAPAGDTPVTVRFTHAETNEILAEAVFHVEVVAAALPKQKLLHTEWFHCDCLATYYGVPAFSEAHWTLIRNYMENAATFGINLILTPVFTPPLDTQIGKERLTVQLVDVTVSGNAYLFDFAKMDRYMKLAEDCGIEHFEISHLFTQWGAKAAPKILARIDGVEKQIFGWETDAAGAEYADFLRSFLTALRAHLTENGRLNNCCFHVSDEPHVDALENYGRAAAVMREILDGCHMMDALSSYAFYETGIVKTPIPSNDQIDVFLEHGVEHLWTYYCCGQSVDVSNRFMAMPSCRNRILGTQLYKYHIEGFLQWGYNFWYSQHSRGPVNPYAETGGEDAFPAGDTFMVYPGADGHPVPSLRQLVLHEGLQDLRALQLLETKLPHADVVALLEAEETITFKHYPCTAEKMLALRERINRKLQTLFA